MGLHSHFPSTSLGAGRLVWQQIPQVQFQSDLVPPNLAAESARFDDARVSDTARRFAATYATQPHGKSSVYDMFGPLVVGDV